MFAEVFRFECGYQARSPLFWTLCAAFFLLAFLGMASENVTIGGGTDNLDLDASFTILQAMYIFGIILVLAAVAFVIGPLLRDRDAKTLELFLATPIRKAPFLLGRLAGGTLFAYLVSVAALLGALVGTLMPWLDAERIGGFAAGPWLFAAFGVLLPQTLIIAGFLFGAVVLWRSLMSGYLMVMALLVFYAVLSINTDAETIARNALFDPFGTLAFAEVTRYWTVAEQNHAVPALTGTMLHNRLIWLGASLLAGLVGFLAFRLELPGQRGRGKAHAAERVVAEQVLAPPVAPPHPARSFGLAAQLGQLVSQLRVEMFAILRSPPLYVLLLFGLFNSMGGFYASTASLYGTPVRPTTPLMVNTILGAFSLMVIMAIVYYTGELVARERENRVAELVDATPARPWTLVAAKILAVWFVIFAMYFVAACAGALYQALNGFDDIRPGVYLYGLFVQQIWNFLLIAVLGVFIQVLVGRKFVGMFLVIAVFLALQIASNLGLEHPLYTFGTLDATWSDFYGFGHRLSAVLWSGAYWSAFCFLLLVAAHLLWQRGTDGAWRARLADARERVTTPVLVALVIGVLAMLQTGLTLYTNTSVLNTFMSSDDRDALLADYEKTYGGERWDALPQIVDIDVDVDIFPRQRRVELDGHYELLNLEAEPIERLRLTLPLGVDVGALELAGATRTEVDERHNVHSFVFDQPLAPGATSRLDFVLTRHEQGFSANADFPRIAWNGTFVDVTHVMPALGYAGARELQDPADRREHDLPPVQRAPDYDDPRGLRQVAFGVKRRAGFRSTVSTSADQIAVAPGYLVREWTEDGRYHASYEMDDPIWPFVAWLSAEYAVKKDAWNDVAIEVYYHPEHDWNVDAMISGAKQALDYFTGAFSPYQYRQYRIFEFPRYATFAQAFPNTIPFSEAIGFTADLDSEDNLDYVLFVTAHELAHQWWAHQLIGADVQGSTFTSETLAQYSALMVMEHAWGEEKMRRFLRYEMDRYLDGRGAEIIEEQPLALVENQPYIHYRKGAVAMYALKDAIGEEAVNRALRRALERFAFNEEAFPRTGDLIALFREEAGPEHQRLITDLFEKIALWDLRVVDASSRALDDGRWEVQATFDVGMIYADGEGNETEAAADVVVDLAVFPPSGGDLGRYELPDAIHRERVRLDSGEHRFTFVVDEEPARVGIDPFAKLIDRVPADNLKPVTEADG